MKIPADLVGGVLCVDFANGLSCFKANDYGDRYPYLLRWSLESGAISHTEETALKQEAEQTPARARAVTERGIKLAEALGDILTASAEGRAPAPADLSRLNREVATAMSRARLKAGRAGFRWGWEGRSIALDRILWPVARSAADLLVSEELARIKVCASDTCQWLFLDSTKNHRRRWCDMGVCGNREKVRRYRSRRQAQASR